MPDTKEIQAPQALSVDDLSKDVVREKAREALRKPAKNASSGEGILALGGILLGGVVLNALLSNPKTRFTSTAVTTAREIGESIRLRRKDLGLTQKELAAKSGTRERFISELERGKETAEVGKVLDLLDALGLETRLVVRG